MQNASGEGQDAGQGDKGQGGEGKGVGQGDKGLSELHTLFLWYKRVSERNVGGKLKNADFLLHFLSMNKIK